LAQDIAQMREFLWCRIKLSSVSFFDGGSKFSCGSLFGAGYSSAEAASLVSGSTVAASLVQDRSSDERTYLSAGSISAEIAFWCRIWLN
jgi:hypothetical protein